MCFNPLPPPKRGETIPAVPGATACAEMSFNPLPPPKRGETFLTKREARR